MIEYGGMILLRQPSEDQARRLTGKDFSRWQYERSANHVHAAGGVSDREYVQLELDLIADFAAALREQYPHRNFVIAHLPCYAVSFYQAVEDAPTEDEPADGTAREQVWCQHCQTQRPYRLLPTPDAQLPQALWGGCRVCENDLIVQVGEIRRLVNAR